MQKSPGNLAALTGMPVKFGIFYSSIGRRAAIMRWRYADATPAFVRTYDAFAALKPALV